MVKGLKDEGRTGLMNGLIDGCRWVDGGWMWMNEWINVWMDLVVYDT